MHELSLVRSLLHQVQDVMREHQAESVENIQVEMGPLSGVEPLLVDSAFQQLAPEYAMAGTTLTIREIPLEARCLACQAEFALVNFHFLCPQCQSPQIQVVRGDQFRLIDITIKQLEEKLSS